MPQRAVRLLEEADGVRAALGPLRRATPEHLREPASATEIALALGVPRQRVNYHVRALEKAGLVELVEERRRRGCTERVLRATAHAFLVDPEVLSPSSEPTSHAATRDRFAAEHLVSTAAGTVRDVGRMLAAADTRNKRLLTFTVEAELRFRQTCIASPTRSPRRSRASRRNTRPRRKGGHTGWWSRGIRRRRCGRMPQQEGRKREPAIA